MRAVKGKVRARDAARVAMARRWLERGRPKQALAELQRLTRQAWKNPTTDQLVWQAAQAFH